MVWYTIGRNTRTIFQDLDVVHKVGGECLSQIFSNLNFQTLAVAVETKLALNGRKRSKREAVGLEIKDQGGPGTSNLSGGVERGTGIHRRPHAVI